MFLMEEFPLTIVLTLMLLLVRVVAYSTITFYQQFVEILEFVFHHLQGVELVGQYHYLTPQVVMFGALILHMERFWIKVKHYKFNY